MPFVKLEKQLRLYEVEAVEIVTKTFVLPDNVKVHDGDEVIDMRYDYNKNRYFANNGYSITPELYVKYEVLPKAQQREKEEVDF